MPIQLPAPDQVRAIVVGIERYAGLGERFTAHGAAKGAFSFAHWLIERKVSPASIALWISMADGSDPGHASSAASLAGVATREFVSEDFRRAMSQPDGIFADGQFLMIYFCGHGVVSREGSTHVQQLLVLPEATPSQLRCIAIPNWQDLFHGSGWERFRTQLWIVDACRDQWSNAMPTVLERWNPDTVHPVKQCSMFSCGTGQTASITSDQGPRFTRELIATLGSKPPPDRDWPDFVQAFNEAATRLRDESASSQDPVLLMGVDWSGSSLMPAPDLAAQLLEHLAELSWANKEFLPYLKRVDIRSDFTEPLDLNLAVDRLRNLMTVRGIPPILEFAARVARAANAPKLEAWVKARLSPQKMAELTECLATDGGKARLSLWYRDDAGHVCIEGDLEILDAGGGLRTWSRPPAKPVAADTLVQVIGQWVADAYAHVGPNADLVVELYLSRRLLTSSALDTAVIQTDEGEDIRLGRDLSVLLRSTDRYKGRMKRQRWQREAPAILSRLDAAGANALHWAGTPDTRKLVPAAFLTKTKEAPVWLGFESACQTGEALLDTALTEGLPAVIFLRASSDSAAMESLLAQLQQLLRSPLHQLPEALRGWRSAAADEASKTASLLLDDPEHFPKIWAPFTQPGG
ncbi:VMAP-C domain-containing protein [Variovorax guangxiensis]|uniref:Caspase family protein n=1 Tax=Variovorax guangxiensis TaxID=1775474 RepID=A0A840FXH0_9BURK|nr:caspase family protein [Variovorax guangxiensis]MBB4224885.1 hypothetical protein [Variovorax guangxiensis]